MVKRILGVLILLIGLSGIVLSVIGTVVGRQVIDTLAVGLDSSLNLTTDGLDNVVETLVLVNATVDDVNVTLETVETTIIHASQAITDTRPLLDEISLVASEDVPNSLEAIQQTIPNLEQVAATIDDTLVTLNDFSIDETLAVPNPLSRDGEPLFSYTFDYDLGINYDPEMPFEESVTQIGGSLDGLPERLHSLATQIDVANENLEIISNDVLAIAGDLDTVNGRIGELTPLLDEYVRLVTKSNDQIRLGGTAVKAQLDTVKLGITIAMIWFGLTQLAPLYIGWELVTGNREDTHREEVEV